MVHWDGKLLPDLTGKSKVDRLPVLVSKKGVSQLLTVAKLPSGTGETQATAFFCALNDWGIVDRIRAMCFDTTSSNTGRSLGACLTLEQKLCKELLALACRHHVWNLSLGRCFKRAWEQRQRQRFSSLKVSTRAGTIDQEKFETGINNKDVASKWFTGIIHY